MSDCGFPKKNFINMQNNGNVINKDTKQTEKGDKVILTNFSNKYGIFGRRNQQNGNIAPDKNTIDGKDSPCKSDKESRSATERFRQAGIKARFVRRIEQIVDERMTVKQIFNRYVENSTLHGFRFIFMQTFVLRRVLWTILTVTMAAIFLSELKNSIELFLEYPFTTTSTMEYIPSLKFPAISICSLNSLQEPRVNSNRTWQIYERALLPMSHHNRTVYDISGKELNKILNESSESIYDIFRGCEWKSRDTAKTGIPNLCYGKNFTTYVDLHGETCYTFNGEKSLDPLLTLNETGLHMALKLEFDLKVNKPKVPLQEIGLKIIVHDQSETPLQQAGFVVSPGFQTIVELKVRKTKNLPGPYATRCGEQSLSFYKNYRQSRCFLEKLTKEIQRNCKCESLFMQELDLNYHYPPCSLNKTVECVLPIVDGFDRKTNTDCPVDCKTTTYGTSLSYARFIPNVPYKTVASEGQSSYIQRLQAKMQGSMLEKYIEENVLVVQFFYQEMKEEKVGQEKSYDHFKLIGDVGGQLGLLLGASVLTLVEFVDLFFFTLYHQVLRLYRRKQQQNEVS